MRAYSSARLERFPDKEEVDGSSPSRPTPLSNGDLAQLVEHRLCKAGVRGSIPLVSTEKPTVWWVFYYPRMIG